MCKIFFNNSNIFCRSFVKIFFSISIFLPRCWELVLLVCEGAALQCPVQVVLDLREPLEAAGLQRGLGYLPVGEVLGECDGAAVLTEHSYNLWLNFL